MATSTPTSPFPTAGSGPFSEPQVPLLDDAPLAPLGGGPAIGDGAMPTAALPRNELLDRVVQGAHDAIDRLAEQAAPALQRLQDGVANTGQMIGKQADSVRDTGGEWADNVRGTVREHPLAAVAAALALGLLVARLTR